MTRWGVHNKVRLALHELRGAHEGPDGASARGARPLLLLHGLGERSTTVVSVTGGALEPGVKRSATATPSGR